jgi:hypothetical protein
VSAVAAIKPRYRVPEAYAEASVSLSEFSTEDIRAYLAHVDGEGGTHATADGELVISSDDVSRINTLALCGQQQHARELLFEIVGRHIGRAL